MRDDETRHFHAFVMMLMGTGILVFHFLGLSISVGHFTSARALSAVALSAGKEDFVQDVHLDLWTVSQRFRMTVGCLLIVGGKLFDARFQRN